MIEAVRFLGGALCYPNAARIEQLHKAHPLRQMLYIYRSSGRCTASGSRFIRSSRSRISCKNESRPESVTSVSDVIENVRINRSLQPVPPTLAPVSRHVWFWTASKGVITAALEAGWDTFIVEGSEAEAEVLSSMARLNLLILEGSSLRNFHTGKEVANFYEISTGFDLEEMTRLRGQSLPVIMDSKNWKLIPAENMVAAFQASATPVFATANSASEARDAFEVLFPPLAPLLDVVLRQALMRDMIAYNDTACCPSAPTISDAYQQALERGTDGVVLRTDDPSDVFALKEYLQSRAPPQLMPLSTAVVTRVELAGMGERVCVDLCSLLKPGEGMLVGHASSADQKVGSFARCLFLVHSECLQADYVASRPFRVNAGPVCAYTAVPGGKTAYLAELHSGSEVMVADWQGRCHVAVVGRAKVERRPMVLVEVETEGGSEAPRTHSLLLQNAETVRLVTAEEGGEGVRAISVSEIAVGDRVLVALQLAAARHTGIAIQESIAER